jgi:hypothetical protein
MKLSSQNAAQGWVLPTTLFGLTLILGTIRLLSVDATAVTRLYGDIHQSHTTRQHALRAIFTTGEPEPFCAQRAITFDGIRSDYEVCGERRIPFMMAPPSGQLPITRIDYDALFANATPCPSTPINAANSTGERVRASKDCVLPPLLQGGIIALENLRGEATRVLPVTTQASILASPGSVALAGVLALETDLVLVAGGDVDISSITTASQQTRRVTLISALGAVRVGYVSPGISVVAAGRGVLEVPETPQNPPFPLPPQRGHGINGIRAIGE